MRKQGNSNTNSAKPSDKIILYLSLGIGALVLIGLVVILLEETKRIKNIKSAYGQNDRNSKLA